MKKIKWSFLVFLCFVAFSNVNISAQNLKKDTIVSGFLLDFQYSIQMPVANLSERYGNNFAIGGSLLYKTNHNFIYGFDANYFFGNKVKEDNILDNIKTSDGYLIDGDGIFNDVFLYERGFYLLAKGGKVFNLIGPNKNSGLFFTFGSGMMQHKIKLLNSDNTVDYFTKEYKKGYDRLASGFCLSQQFGYFNIGNKKAYSFTVSIELTEAFTKPRRGYQYDLKGNEQLQNRFDMLAGLRFSWMLPLFRDNSNGFYFK